VEAGDFSGLTRVGPQGGSNPGGTFQAADGSQWYIKAAQQSGKAWADEQAMAAELYQLAGLDSPTIIVGQGTPGLPAGIHTATEIRRLSPAQTQIQGTTAFRDAVREGFAVDAWLADWDIGQSGNIQASPGGDPIRMDIGGSLRFRARGGPKGKAFGATVGEWQSMQDPNNVSGHLFVGMTDQELIDSADKVTSLDESKIRAVVKRHGGDTAFADLLIARKADIERKAKALKTLRAGGHPAGTDHIAVDDAQSLAAQLAQRQRGAPPSADPTLRRIADQQGFSAVPQLASAQKVGKMGADGTHIVVYRGTRSSGGPWGGGPTKTAKQIHDEFRTGNAHYGTGIYGNGYYTTTHRGTASAYSDSTAGSVVRIAIPKSARIIDYQTINAEYQKWVRSLSSGDQRRMAFTDTAHYAAARGYDVIEVPQGQRVQGRRPETYYVILNRSIVTVTKAKN
jgi:hypothetical protein